MKISPNKIESFLKIALMGRKRGFYLPVVAVTIGFSAGVCRTERFVARDSPI